MPKTMLFKILVVCVIARPIFAEELVTPAGRNSGEPNLVVGADDELYLSWIESKNDRATLQFSTWNRSKWTSPKTVSSGKDWFVNWADFPSLCALEDGTLLAHWLQKSAPDTYAYDVKLSLSHDRGDTWSAPISPHADGTPTEHGFVSLVPLNKDTFGVVWLDGRAMTKSNADMSLRYRTLNKQGKFGPELLLDSRVCECCQTNATALNRDRVLAVYRDRSESEIRDITARVIQGSQRQRSFQVNRDGWHIEGCPVNGPAIDCLGTTVVATWPTTVNEEMQVLARFSQDSGKTWSGVIRLDEGDTIGRVDVTLLDSQQAAVCWVTGGPAAEIQFRIVTSMGHRGPIQTLAATSEKRASGFPRMVHSQGSLFFAWTKSDESTSVKTARNPVNGSQPAGKRKQSSR